jgi:hypothetical protein
MYEGTRPLSETAIFASLDDKATKVSESRIRAVNAKETSCFEVGCPYWVRVAPGTHTFNVRYTANYQWNLRSSGYSYADIKIEVKDMKPRHVYVARYKELNDRVVVVVEDLGENPNYGITLGLEGANKQFYRAEF